MWFRAAFGHTSPLFFRSSISPPFFEKSFDSPPHYKSFGPPPFLKKLYPSKISRKRGKTGYFCPQCSHFFRKGFDLPPFRVSVHILCNMITYISLPKKFPSSSLPPIFWVTHLQPSHFLDLPSSPLQKNKKKTC